MEPTWTWDTARAAGVLADEWLDLRSANLCDANLCGADLHGADLRSANLCDADLHGADLRSANLCGADLTGADLRSADLRSANLCDADLTGANLRGTDLHGADLTGADLDFSAWPLWCGSLDVKVDKRIAAQLAYHFCKLGCADAEYIAARNACLDFANKMHRDVPRLEFKIVETERDKNGNGNEEADYVG